MFPYFFKFGSFTLYSYPMFIGLSLASAFIVSELLFKKFKIDLKKFYNLYIGSVVSAFIGAKLLFVISSPIDQKLILYNSNFWLGGGLVFLGGFIGILIFFIFYNLFVKIKLKEIALLIPGLTVAHSIGRIGCFLAGCCYGKESNIYWAIHLHGQDRHPVQIYESIVLIIITYILIKILSKNLFKEAIIFYLTAYSLARFILEFFRGDKIRGLFDIFGIYLSTSQIISVMLFIIGIVLLGVVKKKNTVAI